MSLYTHNITTQCTDTVPLQRLLSVYIQSVHKQYHYNVYTGTLQYHYTVYTMLHFTVYTLSSALLYTVTIQCHYMMYMVSLHGEHNSLYGEHSVAVVTLCTLYSDTMYTVWWHCQHHIVTIQ